MKPTITEDKRNGNSSRKSSEHTRTPSLSSIGTSKLSGTSLMNNLRQKFKSGSAGGPSTGGGLGGGTELPHTPLTGSQSSPSSKPPSSEVGWVTLTYNPLTFSIRSHRSPIYVSNIFVRCPLTC